VDVRYTWTTLNRSCQHAWPSRTLSINVSKTQRTSVIRHTNVPDTGRVAHGRRVRAAPRWNRRRRSHTAAGQRRPPQAVNTVADLD